MTNQFLFRSGRRVQAARLEVPGPVRGRATSQGLPRFLRPAAEAADHAGAAEQEARQLATTGGVATRSPTATTLGRAGAAAVADAPGGGTALPAASRMRWEQRLGHAFDQVRVHPESAIASAFGANALTFANQIHVAPGRFQPATPHGDRLQGHELAHVAQQARPGAPATAQFDLVEDERDEEARADTDGPLSDTADDAFPALITGEISHPVGRLRGGMRGNIDQDVHVIRFLLNTFIIGQRLTRSLPLFMSGPVSPAMIGVIEDFQRRFVGMQNPDGRVDPGGATLAKLNGSVFQPAPCIVQGKFAICGRCKAQEKRVLGGEPQEFKPIPQELLYRRGSKIQLLLPAAADAYEKMVRAARGAGIGDPFLRLMSGHRRYVDQGGLWRERLLALFRKQCHDQRPCIAAAIDATTTALQGEPMPHARNAWYARFVKELNDRDCLPSGASCKLSELISDLRKGTAPPGRSPHHTGRAIDIYVGNLRGRRETQLSPDNVAVQRRTDAYRWLVCNAHRFGFFPYNAEPWHWEYNP
ncbi:MAG: DUF4157 domain-containing protein [Geminicoccaceae bacterium]|nr:MAG: DUF4157 domain-containing protein [Geminicoccaceae bacterium]